MSSPLIHLALLFTLLVATSCGKKESDNNAAGPCGGPDVRGCLCADQTQGNQTCDPESGSYGDCMCTSMSVDTSCCIDGAFYDCPSVLTADACFNDSEPGACIRDPAQDTTCQSMMPSNNTNNGSTEEEDDPLCWANCRDGHELCADSCGGGRTCWELCEEEHDVCAVRCGGGELCRERCEASPTECAARCA